MEVIHFENMDFFDKKDDIRIVFYNVFHFIIPKKELEKIGDFEVNKKDLVFSSGKNVQKKFLGLMGKYLKNLRNNITNNHATYIHQNSGIPLIGTNYFGIVYRNISLIEIKPQTSCNLNCIYCSVGEGTRSRMSDFIIEKDYLVNELKKLVDGINYDKFEIHVGLQGEPFLYKELLPLLSDINEIEKVETISMDTNGTLMTKKDIDFLSNLNKKVRINISLNSLNQKKADKLCGTKYNLKHVIDIINYGIKKEKLEILIAPMFLEGITKKDDFFELIEFCKKRNLRIGIQNFLSYKTGRNPVKQVQWNDFYKMLLEWEKEIDYKLVLDIFKDFGVVKLSSLKKPFRKGEKILVSPICRGRYKNTYVCVDMGLERTITVHSDKNILKHKKVKVKLTRDKHNIYYAEI